MSALLTFQGVRADHCEVGHHRPVPLRFVWHHLLAQACGGRTEASNLAQVCDGCHYSIHILMYEAAQNGGQLPPLGSRVQRQLARIGVERAIAAGTLDKMPNEGGGFE